MYLPRPLARRRRQSHDRPRWLQRETRRERTGDSPAHCLLLRRTRPLAEGSHLGVTAAYQIESNSYGECRHTTPTSVVVPPIYVGGLLSRLGEGGRREHKELTSTTIMLPMLFIPTLEPFPPIPERYAAPRIEFVAPDENVRTGMRVAALSNPISIIL